MKHLVASSIAVPSVPCFHPNLSFLFSMSQGLYTRKTWSTERPVYQHSLLLKLASGVFSHQTWVLLRWTKTELNGNLSTCAENQSLLQSLQTAALLARCKFLLSRDKKTELNENL